MTRTIRRTDSTARIQITDTAIATVREIGRGHITAAHVAWAINSQLPEGRGLTEAQVDRALREIARLGYLPLASRGHGAYVWA